MTENENVRHEAMKVPDKESEVVETEVTQSTENEEKYIGEANQDDSAIDAAEDQEELDQVGIEAEVEEVEGDIPTPVQDEEDTHVKEHPLGD